MSTRTRQAALALALAGLLAGCAKRADTVDAPPPPDREPVGAAVALPDDPRRWFDFWVGEWDVRNLQLDDGAWNHSGDAVARIWSVAGGGAVLEQWDGTLGGRPLIGFSLRAWDPALDAWSIWLNWHGGRPDGFSEMRGRRDGERIEQFPPGNPTAVRYSFSRAHDGSCRWDQSLSRDGGESWTANWVMQFTRRGEPLAIDAANAPIAPAPEVDDEFEKTRRLDHLIGVHTGTASWADGGTAPARARVSSMLEGFGLLQFVDLERGDGVIERSMTAMGWDKNARGWVALRVDDGPGGIRKLLLEPGSRSEDVMFATAEAPWLRERWRCEPGAACRWLRERSGDGTTWSTEVTASFD